MSEKHRLGDPKLPDFDSPAVQKRLSSSALIGFFKMAEIWGISDDEAQQLLGVPNAGQMLCMKNTPEDIKLGRDTLMRISYLLGIFRAINTLHGKQLADRWISLPNKNVIFGGQSPLPNVLNPATGSLKGRGDLIPR